MLSIIIPTLNEEKYLPLLLESIKRQDFNENYEIIVADAGSKDKTVEIAKSYNCKVVKGGLPAKGRNQGAKVASGDLFLFLDADVKLPNNFLKNSLEEFKEKKLNVASFCLIPQTNNIFLKNIFNLFYNWPIIISQKFLAHGAMGILAEREIFNKVGGFNENVKLAEDHYFVRQGAKIGKFRIINSTKIYIPLRRFKKDGYLKTGIKYLLCGIYMLFLGPAKSDIFQYKFDHYLPRTNFANKTAGAFQEKQTKTRG